MATSTKPAPKLSELRHEFFCLPQEGLESPRIEGFPYYTDDATTGRSKPTTWVTRCVECGVTAYRPIEPGEM